MTGNEKIGPGGLMLVVGPSGSGKDTLLREAARLLSDNSDVRFPRRLITRPSDPASENSIEITAFEFKQLRESGGCTFSWQAHGLGYAIPGTVPDDVRDGKTVVFNASRAVIAHAASRFHHVRVVQIEVSEALLAERLAARGRETRSEIEQRLKRAQAMTVNHDDVCIISNDLSSAIGGKQLADEISAFHRRNRITA